MLDTPCLVIDLPVVDENIARFQNLADAAGLKTRPHIKTHKLPFFAKRQIEAGAIGITCQKIGEAEVMVEGGLRDILLTYNVIGDAKLDRLAALARKCTLSVTCDNLTVAKGLSARFANEDAELTVLVECDTGAGRCGVQSPADASELASMINELPGLRFGGLMTYPPMDHADNIDKWLSDAKQRLEDAGLSCPVVSTGGTPNLDALPAFDHATEHRAGTYIYNDRSLIARSACGVENCAAVVKTTVVSRPTKTRAIIDAGSKALSSDLLGLEGFGMVREAPDASIVSLSEEHGIVELGDSDWDPAVGDVISIIPNHICVVTNLFPTIWIKDQNGEMTEMAVAARGKLR
ncbi:MULTISPECIES: D-TA family PLP-dependent enzyme [Thalassospira]|uniref:Alanine racemase n=1 Tax=Thalassospira profundimaris TaxID=502049 RepID=A0A367V4H7_9PROT|nr:MULTISPECIES: D-TA family PLP-dependent enzyme [Thalassospira]KZB69697.1 alanine racemase [Thalassospira sp. MCCC 1A01148]RCK19190.1 alanine racemase [Thalassospira profundimaris]